jgi:Tubulin like
MSGSMYHSATGAQSPHCLHVVGIGRTGAGYVDAMLRTGEVEDMLVDPRARFTALVVDIGEQDMRQAIDYAHGFRERLRQRNIPEDRFHFQSVVLDVPDKDDLFATLRRYREFLKLEYPRYYWNPNYEPWLPSNIVLPKAGEHIPRAVAKAIYGKAYYDGDKPMDKALSAFADSLEKCGLPSMVLCCFSLAGGTGSGIVVDLARHLATVKLGRRIPLIGVGQLPNSGDPEIYTNGSLFPTLNEIDCMLDDDKNAGVTAVWGDLYRSPFTGGFFVVNPEHSWKRLTAYTETGEKAVRDHIRQMVTNKFCADSFMRFAVTDDGRLLFRAMRPAGFTGAPHETVSGKSRNWTLYNLAKFTHPGVQVLPGEPISKWRKVISEWIDYVPAWSGLRSGFKTDYIEYHSHAPRELGPDQLHKNLSEKLTSEYLLPDDSTLETFEHEFFDHLTAYADIIMPGVAKTDLQAFWRGRDSYDKHSWEEKLLLHSWLLDLGVMMSEPAIRFQGMAGECLWGCACWVVVPYDQMRGDALPPPNRKVILEQGIAMMTKTVVPTPHPVA